MTGLTGLAAHTGADALRIAAAVGWVVLVGAWAVVATRTARGVLAGSLLQQQAVAVGLSSSETSVPQQVPACSPPAKVALSASTV